MTRGLSKTQARIRAEKFGLTDELAAMEQEAAKKQLGLLKRQQKAIAARDDFLTFVKFTMPDPADPNDIDKSVYQAAKHHEAISRVIEEVEKGQIQFLILTMPPRHGKSEIVSRRFPAWYLGRHPDHSIVVATYNDDFAKDFGADVRGIVTSTQYKQVFPDAKLQRGGTAKDRLQTTKGGMGVFVGLGGSLTGRGAHCFPAGTLVATADGEVPIETLHDAGRGGRLVHALCFSQHGAGRYYRPIEAFVEQAPQPVWTLRTEAGRSLQATADHRVWVRERGMTPMKDLAPGDALVTEKDSDVVLDITAGYDPVPVYDIQVAQHHTLFANGIGVSNCLIIDDVIKSNEEARSKSYRDRAWDWFTKVAMTRRMGPKLVVITFTRWHEDDIIGRLTDPENEHYSRILAKKIKIIDLPAIAGPDDPLERKEGEALWPERYDLDFLEEQRALDPLGFEALYQQRPSVADGVLFRREHIRYYDPADLPDGLRIYCASDHAVTTNQRSDSTVLLKVGVDKQNNIYLLDCWWRKARTLEVVEAMLEMARTGEAPLVWWAERGHISQSIGPFLRKRMSETNTFVNVVEVTPIGDKEQRAQSIAARMAMGYVHFPKDKPWVGPAVEQLMSFPNGKHDDFVDTVSYVGLGLRNMVPGSPRKLANKEPRFGTLNWVKEAQRQQDMRLKLADTGGF